VRDIVNIEEIREKFTRDLVVIGDHIFQTNIYDTGTNIIRDFAVMQTADIVIGVHGAGLLNGFFMREGSFLVELRSHSFPVFLHDHFERLANLAKFKIKFMPVLTVELKYNHPGYFEQHQLGDPYMYGRDKNLEVTAGMFIGIYHQISEIRKLADPEKEIELYLKIVAKKA
jgi:hypothetical protein